MAGASIPNNPIDYKRRNLPGAMEEKIAIDFSGEAQAVLAHPRTARKPMAYKCTFLLFTPRK